MEDEAADIELVRIHFFTVVPSSEPVIVGTTLD